jgi:hypothetical protein
VTIDEAYNAAYATRTLRRFPALAVSAVKTNTPRRRSLPAVVLALSLTACSLYRPVLYPNAHFESVGQEVADRDIEACESAAKKAGADRQAGATGELATGAAVGAGVGAAGGAVGGAISGGAGIGAAIGAVSGAVVGFLGAIIGRRSTPPAAYTNFVDRCLREKGYEPTGWQ